MTPQFKFLRRVRIHGGECGAVARALHHEVKGLSLYQADLGKASKSTIERKQMSTKTTLKRIALVAVSALGFGMLSVAPSKAAVQDATAITIGTGSMTTGVFNYIPIQIQLPSATYVAGDTVTINAQITAAPITGGNANAASLLGTGAAAASNANGAYFKLFTSAVGGAFTQTNVANGAAGTHAASDQNKVLSGQLAADGIENDVAGEVSATSAIVLTSTSNTTSAGLLTVYLGINPDLAGTYSVLVSTNTARRTYYSAGDQRATASFTTTGAVASVTMTALNTSPLTAVSNAGVLYRVTLKDSAGNATSLGSLDQIKFTSNDTNDSFFECDNAACTTALTNGVAASTEFVNGVGYFKVANAGTASTTSTITGTVSLASGTTLSTTMSAAFKAMTDSGDATANTVVEGKAATTGYDGTVSQTAGYTMTVSSTRTSSGLKFTLAAAAAAAGNMYVQVTDSSKKILGTDTKDALTWASVCAYAAAATSVTCSVSHGALGAGGVNTFTMAAPTASATLNGVSTTHTVTFSGATALTTGTNTITPNVTNISNTAKGLVKVSATLKDRFGLAAPANTAVTASVAGRNTVAATNLLTNADGMVEFSYTDAGTISANDTVTFSNSSSTAATGTVTVTYGNPDVKTVTISGGNYSAGVLLQTTQTKDISAGDGADLGALSLTATVKDTNGALLVGVPVTWGVTGTGVAILSTSATTWTDSTGVATGSIYGWIAGTYTYTATAGGVVGTGTITFGQTATGEERTISVKDNGNGIVTATAKDRFGNPVPSVTIYATGSGSMTINAKTRDSGTTGTDGNVDFVVTGAGTFTASTISWSAAAGTYGSGQTSAPKGYLGNSSTAAGLAALKLTEYTAGTALVAEEGVGSSFDAAGVATATVAVAVADESKNAAEAASDAAAEAIDAANAATDAANLAAEAADAATVAAEEARDAADAATAAVEELATQVATLMAALKAQITTLANTVAKIAKKVKA